MKYEILLEQLKFQSDNFKTDVFGYDMLLSDLLLEAAKAIKELQSTVVIVEVKENNDGT